MAELNKFIFIYGPPGVGKSSTGQKLADTLSIPFYDLDHKIEIEAGIKIPEIFNSMGLVGFRILESKILTQLLNKQPGVISLGGGALLDKKNRKASSKAGIIILLNAAINVIKDRLANDHNQRPLLQEENKLEELLKDRKSHYDSFDIRIDTSSITPQEISWKIQKTIGRFLIKGMGKDYPVYIEENSLANIGQILEDQQIGKTLTVITDQNVASFYHEAVLESLDKSGFQASSIIIPPGESSKNINLLNDIWGQLLENGMDRKSTILAIGGGVVGDLAGFAAATYMRGIDWIGVPTSLLSMVDSSIGGKTGIDLPQGKNLAGSFHPPILVLVDPSTLTTLPEVEIKNGLAEVVKHGVVKDPVLFEECLKGIDHIKKNWGQIIRHAMAVKISIIQGDPFEEGVRASLNFGHTIGHAIESLSNFSIRHGEAVSIGMLLETKLGESLGITENGLTDRLISCLSNLGLPLEIPKSIGKSQIIEQMQFDKKRKNGNLYFSIPEKVGKVKFDVLIKYLTDLL